MIASLQDLVAVAGMFLGVLFLYSGIAKLLSLAAFVQSLRLIPYFPHRPARQFGVLVPLIEIIAAVFLMLDYLWAKWLAIAIICVFSVVAIVAHSHNAKVPCSCFGIDTSEFLSLHTVIRNSFLVALAGVCIVMPRANLSVLSATFGLVAFLLFLTLNKAIQNHRAFVSSKLGNSQ